MNNAEYTILTLNFVFAFSLGWPTAIQLVEVTGGRSNRLRCYFLLILVYIIESIAFSASMSTSLFSILLALLWGFILGKRFRQLHSSFAETRQASLIFSFYTCLPAVSFLCVPVVMALGGWPILTAEGGFRFGVPDFFPWPLNTILGFCLTVVLFAVACKVIITTGIIRFMTERKKEAS